MLAAGGCRSPRKVLLERRERIIGMRELATYG